MSKPYLSVLVPDSSDLERLTLSLIQIDKALQKVSFDYEIFVPVSSQKLSALLKLKSFIQNLKYAEVAAETDYGSKLKFGLENTVGNIRVICNKSGFGYLESFEEFAPKFKECDILLGKNVRARGGLLARLKNPSGAFLSPDGFIALKEEACNLIFPFLISKTEAARLESLEFAAKTGRKIGKVEYADSENFGGNYYTPSLQLFKEAFIIYSSGLVHKVKQKANELKLMVRR